MKTIIPFFILHMMPMWIYLGGVFLTFKKYKNTEYAITDKAIYVSGGIFGYSYERKEFETINTPIKRQGFFDQKLMVGDVIIDRYSTGYGKNGHEVEVAICDIPDFQNVCSMIIEQQEKIRAHKNS